MVELIGALTREKGEMAIKDDEGKKRLINNLFNGFAGKRIRVVVEEAPEPEEAEEADESPEEETEKTEE